MCALFHPDCKILREFAGCSLFAKTASFKMVITISEPVENETEITEENVCSINENILKQINDKLSYKYEYLPLSTITSKMTASSLDDSEKGFEFITSSKPEFMNKEKMTPAKRGTAMHTFMQFCSYNDAKENLEKEINRLKENGFLTKEQADCLDRAKLSSFFSSSFAKRMFEADNIYREIKVNSFIKASDIYDVDYDDKILVQGIADCVFEENGELILVDYKTDRVKSEEELLERYKKQIAFYRYSIEKTLKMPVKEAVLYSFHLEKICIYK